MSERAANDRSLYFLLLAAGVSLWGFVVGTEVRRAKTDILAAVSECRPVIVEDGVVRSLEEGDSFLLSSPPAAPREEE